MKAILAIAGVAGMTALASGGQIIWDNGPGTGGLYSSQLAADYPFDSQVADDFMFDIDMTVKDVHWWGGWWGGPGQNATDFNIYFYLTDPVTGMPQNDAQGNPDPIATYHFFGLPDTPPYAEYDVDLDPWFQANAGEHYWIAIQAEAFFFGVGQWGWQATSGVQLSPAVQGFPLLGMPYWTPLDVDMGYYLTPAPGALALLGLAGLVSRRRR